MREVCGASWLSPLSDLKRQAIVFDRLVIYRVPPSRKQISPDRRTGQYSIVEADLDFLREKKLIDVRSMKFGPAGDPSIKRLNSNLRRYQESHQLNATMRDAANGIVRDLMIYHDKLSNADVVPIYAQDYPSSKSVANERLVAQISIDMLPQPAEDCAWEAIIDFKTDERENRWAFRRFLRDLTRKQMTEAEIRDDIEWCVHQYTKAMTIHKVKASQSFVDVFVVSPLEIMENLVKLNWSKIAKGALQVQKRKVELMEAEMKEPGRECAYVFDARKQFGAK
jgi:hypothetical protein